MGTFSRTLGAAPVFVLFVIAALSARPATARTIIVEPGPGTPLQDAIDGAAEGDVVFGVGTFTEPIVVNKRVKIRSARIEADCSQPSAVVVTASGAQLERVVAVGGGTVTLDLQAVSRVGFSGAVLGTCPTAQYGIRVQGGSNIKLQKFEFRDDGAVPYRTAAIYLTGVQSNARIQVRSASCRHAPIGILAENVGSKALVIRDMGVGDVGPGQGPDVGVAFRNVIGGRVLRSGVSNLATRGIELDLASADNRVLRTTASSIANFGPRNCGTGNNIQVGMPPLPPC